MKRYKFNENLIITEPGKFECELAFVPLLWDWVVAGDAEELEGHPEGGLFKITDDLILEILAQEPREHTEQIRSILHNHLGQNAMLTEDNEGFVRCTFADPVEATPPPTTGETYDAHGKVNGREERPIFYHTPSAREFDQQYACVDPDTVDFEISAETKKLLEDNPLFTPLVNLCNAVFHAMQDPLGSGSKVEPVRIAAQNAISDYQDSLL